MRFYRALLRLYPASFRAEYERELTQVFAARRAGAAGVFASIVTIALALADVVPNAIAAHWDILRHDLRYTARSLRRTPGFALTAVLVIALGVGANAAAFSLANFVLLRPLPFEKPEQLVRLWQTEPGYSQMELSPPNFHDWKVASKSFDALAAYTSIAMNLTGSGEPRRVQIAVMSWDMPRVLGVHSLLGRTFVVADTAAPAVLLGYDLWQTQFGGDQSVVGRQVELDGSPYSVIGVMPRDFRFPSRDDELWTALPFVFGPDYQDRSNNFLYGIGRLKPGVTLDQARAEMRVIAARLEHEFPKENEKTGANLVRLSEDLGSRNRLLLYGLCGAALCILLLACANLANLLLVRAVSREREIAVRTALGAGRDRLVRQLLTESALLIGLGAAAGVLVAVETVPALARLVPMTLPIAGQPSLDWRVLLIASLLIALTGAGFGVFPALRAGGSTLDALRDGARSGGRRQRVRSALVMVEVMASVVLLVSSGLLMRAMWRLQTLDPGFRAENVLTLLHGRFLPDLRGSARAESLLHECVVRRTCTAGCVERGVRHRFADVDARRDLARRDPRPSGDANAHEHGQPAVRDASVFRHARHSAAPRSRHRRDGRCRAADGRRGERIVRATLLAQCESAGPTLSVRVSRPDGRRRGR